MPSNQDIAQMFNDIADAMEVLGENRFRINAYRRAGETVSNLTIGLDTIREQQDLTSLPHIGPASAQIITEVFDQGYSPLYDALLTQVPPGVLELLRVPAVGPKSAARLYHEFGISNRAALYAAAQAGALRTIKGFGAKTEARIITAIEHQLKSKRLRIHDALRASNEFIAAVANLAPIQDISPAGSVRRGQSTVGDLNFVVAAKEPHQALQALAGMPQLAHSSTDGTIMRVTLHNGMHATIAICTPVTWGNTLIWWTGTAAHLAGLNALKPNALTLSEPDSVAYADEAAVYAALGLPWIPPELREGWGEIELAQRNALPTLITTNDIRADLHWHTQWSDGRGTLETMTAAGRLLGYTHMAVADHSAYLGVTGGLNPKRLKEQRKAIDALNATFAAEGSAFRLLQCCEVDILPDGSLALPDEALAALDVVVASPHVALRQDHAAATARMLRAINNPHVDIIGHPTGRLLEERQGLDVDFTQLIEAAAASDTALEVNAGPERLDLDAPLIRQALQAGVKLSINTDAHDPNHLVGIDLGVLTARRGGATAANIINTWSLEALLEWTQRSR